MGRQLGPRSIFLIAGGLLVVTTAFGLWNSARAGAAEGGGAHQDGSGGGSIESPDQQARTGKPDWPGDSVASRRRHRARSMEGIHGVLLDGDLQPLGAAPVELMFVGSADLPVAQAITDADGLFSFVDLTAGAYQVVTSGRLRVASRVEHEVGQAHEIELKLPPAAVLLTGTLRDGGQPVDGREIQILGNDAKGRVDVRMRTDGAGAFRCLLRAGDYELGVHRELQLERPVLRGGAVAWLGVTEPMPLRQQLDLSDPVRRHRVDLELPQRVLRTVVVDARTRQPCVGARVELVGIGSALTDDSGVLLLRELPIARYEVVVSAPGWPRPEPQLVDLGVGASPEELRFALQPGGAVSIVLLDDADREVRWQPEFDAAIRHLESGITDVGELVNEAASQRWFLHVPAGKCEFVLRDQRISEAIRFRPLAPMSAPIEMVAGATSHQIVRGVRQRAFGSFGIVDVVGQPVAGARIEVWAVDPPLLQALPAEGAVDPGRWEGYLAPGRYDVVAQIGGAELRHRLSVAREDVEFVFRPGQPPQGK